MTKEKVIDILKGIKDGTAWLMPNIAEDGEKAIDIAIKAVEHPEPHWIPCSERPPEEEGFYLVTLEHEYGAETSIRFFKFENGERYWSKWGNETITAWMQKPEPYKGVTE